MTDHTRAARPFFQLSAALALLSAAVLPQAAQAEGGITAFKLAVAEAASDIDGLAAFYRETDYVDLFTGADDADRRFAVLNALLNADDHGLPAGRYAPQAFRSLFDGIDSERQRGFAEVAAAKMFLSYARDMESGALEPGSIDAGIVRTLPRRDPAKLLQDLAEGEPTRVLHDLIPQSPHYARLMRAKFELETTLAAGGWGETVRANALRPGETGPSVIQLRDRLVAMGYLAPTATATYDGSIEAAVRQFQIDTGLEPDGVAGASTIRNINVEPVQRLQQVLVGLERERWINFEEGLGQRHIMVNIPDFHVQIYDDGKVSFETRSVVGRQREDKRTPEFSDMMDHMVINPTWHVPRSIATLEYLPNMQRNPNAHSYLRLIDGAGRVVPRSAINFAAYTPGNFPFDMQQPPSNSNALGLVKFMFPNPWNIYLHDSPAKNLFNTEVRTHSSGCVRLARPFEFGYALLAKQEDDPVGTFQRILRTGQETRVDLENPVPVHITYRTVWAPVRGNLQYRDDVYGRDRLLWSALERAGVALRAVQS